MDDELNLDRAIDVPVYQDVLAWEGVRAGRFEMAFGTFLAQQVRYLSVSALLKQMWISC